MIFVTGGTGFLGMHLLRALVIRGKPVRALKREKSKIPEDLFLPASIEWVEGNILDLPSLEEHMDGCEEVYHCAGMVSFQSKHRETLMKVNVEGTDNVVNVALSKKIRKLVHVSSVSAIGRPLKAIDISEATIWDSNGFNSNYGISKYLAEREVWRAMAEGLNAVIVNPTIIIGDGNWYEGSPRFFLNRWEGMRFYSSGTSGFVAAVDVAELMIRLMNSEIQQERFIINAEDWSYRDLFFNIADAMGKKRPTVKASRWLTEMIWRLEALRSVFVAHPPLISRETARISQLTYHFDTAKIKAAMGFTFTPIKKCIEDTAKIFLDDVASGKVK
ncbi:MAG: NAD-dependent epimerase/dehydratase family protein [Chitinophagales bacterium]